MAQSSKNKGKSTKKDSGTAEKYSLAPIFEMMSLDKYVFTREIRTYERNLQTFLSYYFINNDLFKVSKGKYSVPVRFVPLVQFFIKQSDIQDSLVFVLSSPKPKEPTMEQKLVFYYDYLVWVKQEFIRHLEDKKTIKKNAPIDCFMENIIDRLPEEEPIDKLWMVVLDNDEFYRLDDDDSVELYNQIFYDNGKHLTLLEVLHITRIIRTFLEYKMTLVRYKLHEQLDRIINQHLVIGTNEDMINGIRGDRSVNIPELSAYFDMLWAKNLQQAIVEKDAYFHIYPKGSYEKEELKLFIKDLDYKIQILKGTATPPDEEEDEYFEELVDYWDAVEQAASIYLQLQHEQNVIAFADSHRK